MKNGMYEDEDGCKAWYLNGRLHREDGPAVEYATGTREWWVDGELHREDGPAVERASGTEEWYLNGRLHREDGPAVEDADGSKWWYLNGGLHRDDGPAVEGAGGDKEWWVDGKPSSEEYVMGKAACRCPTVPPAAAEDYLDMLKLCRLVHAEVLGKDEPNMRVVQTLMAGWAERFLGESDD